MSDILNLATRARDASSTRKPLLVNTTVLGLDSRHNAGIPGNLVYIWRVRLTDPIAFVACAAALTGVSVAAWGQTPGVHLLGVPVGYGGGTANSLSADGRTAAGYSLLQGGARAFLWSEGLGRNDFGVQELVQEVAAISGDGTTVVGQNGGFRAFRWQGAGTLQNLPMLGQHQRSAATGVSGDGSIVVGRADTFQSSFGEAWRWTQTTGMQGLGFTRVGHISSEANGISRDGAVIVGTSRSASGDTDAFAWTAATGMRILPLLASGDSGEASGTNSDGSLIVGYAYDAIGLRTAAMWTSDSLQLLTAPPGWRSWATDLSDDGSVVLGTLSTNNAGSLPAIWTPAAGWLFATDYFAGHGITIPSDWVLGLDAISADGRTFSGAVRGPNLQSQGVVITVPGTGSCVVLIMSSVLAMRRKRSLS